jgi:hypothetical protein
MFCFVKLYALAEGKLVLIAPISDDPVQTYECVIRDGVRELLISARYLQQIYGIEAVELRSISNQHSITPGKHTGSYRESP